MGKTNVDIYNNEELHYCISIKSLTFEESCLISKYIPGKNKESRIVEAGCGEGRILFELQKKGFGNLYGFDAAAEPLKFAGKKAEQLNAGITFSNQNAVSLDYPDGFFDYAIYLQQIMSFIENADDRQKAVNECYRILKTGGRGIFSFLWWEGRAFNPVLAILNALSRLLLKGDANAFKKFRLLPWLRLGGKINLKWLIKEQPRTYWFKTDEVVSLFTAPGFKILEISSGSMIKKGKTGKLQKGGGLYVVVEKV
jgi:SAM-dependent methyltransferase